MTTAANKTQDLLAKIKAGTHCIDGETVNRWVASRGWWVRDLSFRADVIRRAAIALRAA
jgi:hypothetical protein